MSQGTGQPNAVIGLLQWGTYTRGTINEEIAVETLANTLTTVLTHQSGID